MDYQGNQGFSMKIWYLIGTVVIIAFAVWYFYGRSVSSPPPPPPPIAQNPTAGQANVSSFTAGNTTADIANDLSNTPDATAALNADAAASAQAVQGL